MPTIIIEGPKIGLTARRNLAKEITRIVAGTYRWDADSIIVILHQNPDDTVARGGRLISDRRVMRRR